MYIYFFNDISEIPFYFLALSNGAFMYPTHQQTNFLHRFHLFIFYNYAKSRKKNVFFRLFAFYAFSLIATRDVVIYQYSLT